MGISGTSSSTRLGVESSRDDLFRPKVGRPNGGITLCRRLLKTVPSRFKPRGFFFSSLMEGSRWLVRSSPLLPMVGGGASDPPKVIRISKPLSRRCLRVGHFAASSNPSNVAHGHDYAQRSRLTSRDVTAHPTLSSSCERWCICSLGSRGHSRRDRGPRLRLRLRLLCASYKRTGQSEYTRKDRFH